MSEPNVYRNQFPHIVPLAQAGPGNRELLGNKAFNLSLLTQAGVPVPEGYVLTTEAFDIAQQLGTIPEDYINDVLKLTAKLGDVAIRSSATVEDRSSFSLAGVFETRYVVDGNPDSVKSAIRDAYDHALSPDVARLAGMYDIPLSEIKMGLIIQKLIHPDFAGVMYYPEDSDDAVIEYIAGFGRKLVDGEQEGITLIVSKEKSDIRESSGFDDLPISNTVVGNLIRQGKIIQELFGGTGQDIEFTNSAEGIHIVQARPITRKLAHTTIKPTAYSMLHRTRRRAQKLMTDEMAKFGTTKSVFHLNNFAELMPDPSPMDIGIFQMVFTGLGSKEGAIQLSRRRMGYPDAASSIGYLHYLGGKAYESLAGEAVSFYAGFPASEQEYLATLVAEYLDVVYDSPTRATYPQLGLYLRHPDAVDLEERFGSSADRYMNTYLSYRAKMDEVASIFLARYLGTEAMPEDFTEQELVIIPELLDDAALLEAYNRSLHRLRTKLAFDFDTAAHMAFYYTQLLEQKLADHPMLEEEDVGTVLSALTQGLDGSAITEANIAIWSAPNLDSAYHIATRLIGHYQIQGEAMEIRQPRLIDSPEAIRHYVRSLRDGDNYLEVFERQKSERIGKQEVLLAALEVKKRHDFANIMIRAQKFLALRETLKDQLTKEYVPLRNYLTAIGARAGLDEGDVFYLYPNEIQGLLNDASSVDHLIDARRADHKLVRQLIMPRIIRHDTVNDIQYASAKAEVFTQADGQLIAAGHPVEGVVVNLDEALNYAEAMDLIDSLRAEGQSVILVAGIMNLTHDPYLNKADGLILQSAGFVSHGAQRARELGVGALSGIDTARLHTGMLVLFDPEMGVVRNLNEEKQ